MTISRTKLCSKCKKEKPLAEFRNQTKGKYGKKNYCIICDDENARKLYEKNREYKKLQSSVWNQNNPHKTQKYRDNYRKNHPKD
jgi:hypothetical protein